MIKSHIKLISVLLFFSIIVGCTKYDYKFRNGLQAVDLSSGNYTIIRNEGEIIVYPRILKFCKIGNNIIGFRVDSKGDNSDGGPEFTNNLGYFELNVDSLNVKIFEDRTLEDLKKRCGNLLRPVF
jgi:hypothetical protein